MMQSHWRIVWWVPKRQLSYDQKVALLSISLREMRMYTGKHRSTQTYAWIFKVVLFVNAKTWIQK